LTPPIAVWSTLNCCVADPDALMEHQSAMQGAVFLGHHTPEATIKAIMLAVQHVLPEQLRSWPGSHRGRPFWII